MPDRAESLKHNQSERPEYQHGKNAGTGIRCARTQRRHDRWKPDGERYTILLYIDRTWKGYVVFLFLVVTTSHVRVLYTLVRRTVS